jgi:hypothetical protein
MVYRVKTDRKALTHGMLRVVDESGEDYLFPTKYFKPIIAPKKLRKMIEQEA